jgi:hypothetical protein
MKRVEAMKNLWMLSGDRPPHGFVHSAAAVPGVFAPTLKRSQRIDLARHSGVIPLRGASY